MCCVVHARDLYKAMLLSITHAMREREFRGSSGKYFLAGGSGHIGSVSLSGNPKRSTAEVAYLHIHYEVQSSYHREWEAVTAIKAKTPSAWSDHDWFEDVPPPNRDIAGWPIFVSSDSDAVAEEIVTVLDRTAIPAVRESLDDAGLRKAIDASFVGTGQGAPGILLDISIGNLEAARSRIAGVAKRCGNADPGTLFLLARLAEAEGVGKL